jgi:long-chain acyl-CoA synthetase
MKMTTAEIPRVAAATLPEALRRHARERPGATALTAPGEEHGYAALQAVVDAAADRLRGLGLAPGDRVALLGDNTPAWVAAFLACLDGGLIAAPVNQRVSAPELLAQLRLAGPRLLLADEAHAARAAGVAARAGVAWRPLGGAGGVADGSASPGSQRPSRRAAVGPGAGSPAVISFTSGSTGAPKGALITHGALVAAARAYARVLGTGEADRSLVMVPLCHNTGFCDQLTQMLLVGGTVDLLGAFSTSAARAALVARPSSFLMAVPGILRLLMLAEDADAIFGGCRIACHGGAPMPRAWIDELTARWPWVRPYDSYGLTEFTSVSHLLRPEDLAGHAGSVGRPVDGVRQRIVDAAGAPVPAGATGLIELAGPTRMLRYVDAPEATAAALRGPWLRTGDVGRLSPDGYLHLAGRAADVINRGGEKISPLQVESALHLHPQVAEAAVVGAPHPIFGEQVVAFVTRRGTAALDEDEVRAGLGDHVAQYAVPARLLVVDELPRNAAGKVDRPALRRAAAATCTPTTTEGASHGTAHA